MRFALLTICVFFSVFVGCFREDSDHSFEATTIPSHGSALPRDICKLTDGTFIILGTKFHPSGDEDIFLAKINSNLDTVWTKTIDLIGNDYAESIQQSIDGGFIITGFARDWRTLASYDCFLLKTDPHGNPQWHKTYEGVRSGSSVVNTSDNGYLIAGSTISDPYLFKTDISGNVSWSKTYVDPVNGSFDDICPLNDTTFFVAGSTSPPNSSWEVEVLKINLNGDTIWAKYYGTSIGDVAQNIKKCSDGSIIITAFTNDGYNSSMTAIRIDQNGNEKWTVNSPIIGFPSDVETTSNGGCTILGSLDDPQGTINQNLDIIGMDSSGSIIWNKSYGSPQDEFPCAIISDVNSEYIILGGTGNEDNYSIFAIRIDDSGNRLK